MHALVTFDIRNYFASIFDSFQEVINSRIHIKLVILVHITVLDVYLNVRNH